MCKGSTKTDDRRKPGNEKTRTGSRGLANSPPSRVIGTNILFTRSNLNRTPSGTNPTATVCGCHQCSPLTPGMPLSQVRTSVLTRRRVSSVVELDKGENAQNADLACILGVPCGSGGRIHASYNWPVVRAELGYQIACRLREQNLSAAAGCADAGGPVNIDANVAGVRHRERLTRVESHPCPHAYTLGPGMHSDGMLCCDSSRDRIRRSGEDDEEGVSLSIDLLPASLLGGPAKQSTILCEHLRIAGSQVPEETCGALEISKEKGNCSRWQTSHKRPPLFRRQPATRADIRWKIHVSPAGLAPDTRARSSPILARTVAHVAGSSSNDRSTTGRSRAWWKKPENFTLAIRCRRCKLGLLISHTLRDRVRGYIELGAQEGRRCS